MKILSIELKSGETLLPIAVNLLNAKGKPFLSLPRGTYHAAGILIGKWSKGLS